jgi:dihydroneopterin aldolase/2-amino-4-hydroxy-6-hydroxymethyldihydropteridine diphosphokinase
MEKVVLGLGSNAGSRFGYLKKSLEFISLLPDFNFLAVSPVFETEPWGFKNQNNFLNCTLVGFYRAEPFDLIRDVKKVEFLAGRRLRGKWHPREIDVDILFFGDKKLFYKDLTVPHPQIQYRNFVLKPLEVLMPDFIHPVLKKTIKYLSRNSKDICRVKLYKHKLLH